MLGEILRRIVARFTGAREDDGDAEGNRFVPSPLDLSVRYAHGGNTHDVRRELADIEERARELERRD